MWKLLIILAAATAQDFDEDDVADVAKSIHALATSMMELHDFLDDMLEERPFHEHVATIFKDLDKIKGTEADDLRAYVYEDMKDIETLSSSQVFKLKEFSDYLFKLVRQIDDHFEYDGYHRPSLSSDVHRWLLTFYSDLQAKLLEIMLTVSRLKLYFKDQVNAMILNTNEEEVREIRRALDEIDRAYKQSSDVAEDLNISINYYYMLVMKFFQKNK